MGEGRAIRRAGGIIEEGGSALSHRTNPATLLSVTVSRGRPRSRGPAMLTLLLSSVLSAETSLLNSVPLTADLANGEAKTYKLLLDVDVR